jgi:hypothetical protein
VSSFSKGKLLELEIEEKKSGKSLSEIGRLGLPVDRPTGQPGRGGRKEKKKKKVKTAMLRYTLFSDKQILVLGKFLVQNEIKNKKTKSMVFLTPLLLFLVFTSGGGQGSWNEYSLL